RVPSREPKRARPWTRVAPAKERQQAAPVLPRPRPPERLARRERLRAPTEPPQPVRLEAHSLVLPRVQVRAPRLRRPQAQRPPPAWDARWNQAAHESARARPPSPFGDSR